MKFQGISPPEGRKLLAFFLINGAVAPSYQQVLVEAMKSGPAINGSSDSGIEKMNLTV